MSCLGDKAVEIENFKFYVKVAEIENLCIGPAL